MADLGSGEFVPLGYQVEVESIASSFKGHSAYQENGQHDVGEGGSHIYHLKGAQSKTYS